MGEKRKRWTGDENVSTAASATSRRRTSCRVETRRSSPSVTASWKRRELAEQRRAPGIGPRRRSRQSTRLANKRKCRHDQVAWRQAGSFDFD